MSRTCLALLLLSTTLSAATPAPPDDPDSRIKYLISRLDAKVPELAVDQNGEVSLPSLLENLPLLTAERGFEMDLTLQFRISLDVHSFTKANMMPFDPEKIVIKFIVPIKNEPLSNVLKSICEQIGGAYVIRKNRIEIIPLNLLRKELQLNNGEETDFLPLIHWIGSNVPLERVFQDISRCHDANIVISAAAKEKAKTAITARLLNAPIEAAVESLAEMADLQVVRNCNILLVTTKEHAAAIKAAGGRDQ